MDHYQLTDDQQVDIMKNNLQTNGQITDLSDKPYELYKQIDIEDCLNFLKSKYYEHTPKNVILVILKDMLMYFLV